MGDITGRGYEIQGGALESCQLGSVEAKSKAEGGVLVFIGMVSGKEREGSQIRRSKESHCHSGLTKPGSKCSSWWLVSGQNT